MLFKSSLCLAAIAAGIATSAWSADFTVITTNDAGAGSLRQAITEANASPGLDRVLFNIPGEGLQIIRLATALPHITDPAEIDGYSQPGSRPNQLADADNALRLVQIDGGGLPIDGLILQGGNSVLRGLSIGGFGTGLYILSSSNLLVGNHVGGADPSAVIQNNELQRNGVGVRIWGTCCMSEARCCNTIGGLLPEHRNVILNHGGSAIRLSDQAGTDALLDTKIIGNFLGVDSSGLRFLRTGSIYTGTVVIHGGEGLVIGGLEQGARNVIGGQLSCITLYPPARHITIAGNFMGVGADGVTPTTPGDDRPLCYGVWFTGWGNESELTRPPECRIESNRIAYNWAAVVIPDGQPGSPSAARRITITKNSIFANGSISNQSLPSIAFGFEAPANDSLDADYGGNNHQNYPEIGDAVISNTDTVVSGALNSSPLASFRIEFFANKSPHSAGFGEGENYLGFTDVQTDATGTASYSVTLPKISASQRYISATATDSEGNTSVFSPNVPARSATIPLVHMNPASWTVLPYSNVLIRAEITGAEPLSLQWQRNGLVVPGATNLSLSLSNVVWDDRGSYVLVASNSFGVAESLPAQLTVIAQPTILVPPTDAFVFPGADVTFSVEAGGMLPIAYQWRRNGVNLPGATNPSLTLTSVDWPIRGDYSGVLSNAFGVIESEAAGLYVKIRPIITQQPLSQSVVSNGSVTLSVAVSNSATLPLSYTWRSNNVPIATEVSMSHVSLHPVTNFRANAGYAVVVSNYFGPPGVLSARANLTILPDSDGDGLPDAYEDAYNLDRNDPADASLDSDNDGVTNTDEYKAGTDPRDSLNQLRIRQILAQEGVVELEFMANSNKTHAVQFRDAFSSSGWQVLIQLPASISNRVERVTDPHTGSHRFYRLSTPQ